MVKDLVEKRARLNEEASAILKKAHEEKRESLTSEEQVKFDKLHDEMDVLKGTIDRYNRQEQVENELAKSLGRRTEPTQPNPEHRYDSSRVITASEEDRLEGLRTWLLAGSDARTSITPQQAEIARRVGYDLNSKQIDWRLSVRAPRDVEAARNWEYRVPQGVGTGPIGGFTVPNETMQALEVALLQYGGIRQGATIMRTGTGALMPWPTVNDTAQKGVLLGENTTATEQGVTFATISFNAYKYSSKYVLVSVEMLQDSSINVAGYIGTALGTRIARITSDHYTTGTGSAQPNGIVTAATLGKTGTTGQTTSIIYDDLVDLEHSVDPAYRLGPGAKFMMNDNALKAIKKLKDSQGRPLWLPGLAVSAPDTILGYPYVINQSMSIMTAAAKSVLFGDLSKYVIRDVMDISLLRLDERFAEFYQVAFLAFYRGDGQLVDAGTKPVAYYANSAS